MNVKELAHPDQGVPKTAMSPASNILPSRYKYFTALHDAVFNNNCPQEASPSASWRCVYFQMGVRL